MKANAKEAPAVPSFDEQWEEMKAKAWPVKLAFLHTPTEVARRTERTISDSKFPGIQMFWSPMGLMVEFQGYKEILPAAGVAKVRH